MTKRPQTPDVVHPDTQHTRGSATDVTVSEALLHMTAVAGHIRVRLLQPSGPTAK